MSSVMRNRSGRGRIVTCVVAVGALIMTGCASVGQQSAKPGAPGTTSGSSGPIGQINVYAAASLTSPFTRIGKQLESTHPGLKVVLVFAGSSELVSQLSAGAKGDVFASADETNMDKVLRAGLVGAEKPKLFAANHLAIVTAPGNPHGISSLSDLVKPNVSVVVCAEQVPCGGATKRVLKKAGVGLNPVSEENSATSVLGKVTSGQADAGLVYRTDAQVAGSAVARVDFPESDAVVNRYSIAVMNDSGNKKGSDLFVAEVTGPEGQKVLREYGFVKP